MGTVEKSKSAVAVNRLPTPTYRFLKVNEAALLIPETAAACRDGWDGAALPQGVALTRIGHFADLPERLRAIESGMGEAVDQAYAERGIPAAVLTAEEDTKPLEPVTLPIAASCGASALSALVIHAKAGSDLTVIVDITGGGEGCANAKGFLGLSTRILAERDARVHLIHVQRLGAEIGSFDDIGGLCGDGAAIRLTTLLLGSRKSVNGGGETFLGARVTLSGESSVFENSTGYYCGGNARLDMNFVADQRGRGTEARMSFRGVLADHAAKTWRGTIDFKRGSAGSAGDEQEDTLMLSPDVRNRSVPVILCAEEDVDGRHGASIGQLSEEMLFYMSSRGYTEEEARRLIVQARLKAVAREIPEQKLRWEIEQWIEREIA